MDYKYWNNYYKESNAPEEPSDFAKNIYKYLENGKNIIELGCGNGRDAIFFASQGMNVAAIDQAKTVIDKLNSKRFKDVEFIEDNFVSSKVLKERKFDYAYSRFTMHSITEKEESMILKNVYDSLEEKGLFFIEARSVKDEIYGLGELVDRNTYIYNEHSRRFLVLHEIVSKLEEIGFNIIYKDEKDGWAVYKDKNPVVIRIIAEKSR